MNYPVLVTFDDGINVYDGQFNLNAILLSALSVTAHPAKTVYRTGERISYAGLAVTAVYTDESTADVTSMCSISPLENSVFDGDTLVEISYREGQDEQSTTLQLTHLYITELNITQQPDKTVYKTGEVISYDGLAVTATYSDGSARDVTDSCYITPTEGKAFDPDTDTQVEISYDDVTASMSLTANTVRSIAVTSNPVKTWYRQGENIDYTGLVITATYADGSTEDVTGLCSIAPLAGKSFNPNTDTYVEISFIDNAYVNFALHELYITNVSITSNPEKTSYKYGETINYTGLTVTASYSDGSTEDITDSCTISPATGKPFNMDTDTQVEITYGDYSTALSLTPVTLSNVSITSNPEKTSYKYGETIDYTGLTVTATYSDGSTEDITDSCTISPAEGKAFDPDTDTSILITYSEGQIEHTTSLPLTAIYLSNVSVTSNPEKTTYRYGEAIDYTGLVVTATYSDGSTENVTSSCSFSPAEGKAFDPDNDSTVYISYSDTQTVSLNLTAITFTGLSVTSNPIKTVYKYGQLIDYTGLVVTASYSNGITMDVTALCSISPAEGKPFDPDTDSSINISYSEPSSSGTITENISLMLTPVFFSGLAVSSMPSKTNYSAGEPIDYSGLVITASYSDGSTVNVTSSCTFSPAEGKAFDPDTDTTVSITYSELGIDSQNIEISLTAVTLTGLSVSSNPAKTSYIKGETIDYTGLIVTATYSDSSTADVTNSCSISPRAGKPFDPDTDSYVNITYATETASIMLTEIYMTGLQITSYPLKTAYKFDELISYVGLVVSANYSDGSSVDVTSKCEISPRSNKKFDDETDTQVEISYSQGDDEASCSFSLTPITLTSLAVTTNPETTVYSSGEAISYSGIVVTASYSDHSEDDVTNKCVFSPSSGKSFSPDTDTNVIITYSEGQSEQYCTLILTEAPPMTLVVATMPTKTSYNPGEALDFSGAVIRSQFLDGTSHNVTDFCDFSHNIAGTQITVTAKCAYPAAPHAFDFNKGYVDGSTWKFESSSTAYSDIYRVKAGHKYLLILDEHVGNRFKVMFSSADVSKASDDVTGTAITDTSNPAIYASAEYTPSSNGYIIVTKDSSDKAGVKTYLYDANSSAKNVTAQFTLSTVAVTALAVTKPVKTRYRTGQTFDHTGAIVTATYSDGTVLNVTENAVFSPASGATVISSDTSSVITSPVSVSFAGLDTAFDVTLGGFAILSLSVTPPDKTLYRVGEAIDYSGCTVTAVYWDGSTKDVTANAVFQPSSGTAVSRYSIDNDNNLAVSISYQEIDETVCSNFAQGEQVSTYSYAYDKNGDAMWYASTFLIHLSVTYLDTQTGITETKILTAGDFTYDPNITSASYLSYENYADLLANGRWFGYRDYETGQFIKTELDTYMQALTAKEFGGFALVDGQFGYYVSSFHDLFPDNVEEKIGSGEFTSRWFAENCAGRYPLGRTFVPLLTVYYEALASHSINLSVATLLRTLSITPPAKTTYHYREALDCSGCIVTASYSNGDTDDITTLATFSPAAGTLLTSSRSVQVSYKNSGNETATGSFSINVIRLSRIAVTSPEKSSYRYGEAIDYTGATVTAVYSDGSMENVTSSAVFSPTNGSIITQDMTGSVSVSVSYTNQWNETVSGSLSLGIITLQQELQITPPDKTTYHRGENISYRGAIINAVFSDGSTEDVTASAVFSPANGTVITQDTPDSVSITYSNQWSENAEGSLTLTFISLQHELQITPPDKTSYHLGEAIDYSGAVVTAVYSDNTAVDVTSYAVFSPANGTVVTQDTPDSVSITYSNQWSENAEGSLSLSFNNE